MTDDDQGTTNHGPVPDRKVPERADDAGDGPEPDRRVALVELARLAALAPAMAVLFDPERSKAAS